MASLTWWTWVWVNSGSWWWTGRPGVLQFMGRKESDTTGRLNWAELYCAIYPCSFFYKWQIRLYLLIPYLCLADPLLSSLFSISVILFFVICVLFFRFHIYIYDRVFFFLWLILLSIYSLGPSTLLQVAKFYSFYGWVCINIHTYICTHNGIYVYICHISSIHLLMGTLVVSISWLL